MATAGPEQPRLLPGLTVEQAAAPRSTLVAVTIAIIGGGLLLAPSLALLFRLTLGGRLVEHGDSAAEEPTRAHHAPPPSPSPGRIRLAGVLALVGFALLTVAEAGWAHAAGLAALAACVLLAVRAAFLALLPPGPGP